MHEMENAIAQVSQHLKTNGGRFATELATALEMNIDSTENVLKKMIREKELKRKKVQLPHMRAAAFQYFLMQDDDAEDRQIKISKPVAACAPVEVSAEALQAANPFGIKPPPTAPRTPPDPVQRAQALWEQVSEDLAIEPDDIIAPLEYINKTAPPPAPRPGLRFAQWSDGEITISDDGLVLVHLLPAEAQALRTYLAQPAAPA